MAIVSPALPCSKNAPNAPKDLGRPARFSTFGREIMWPKQESFVFD